jgi:hypothetical protein
MIRAISLGAVLLAAFMASSPAGATTITYSDAISMSSTNWSTSTSVPQFDPALGTLNSITFTLDGSVLGTGKFESLDASPSQVTMDLQATLKLKRPSGTVIVQTIPVFETIDNVTAFDGLQDYAGTSGKTYTDVGASSSDSVTTSTAADKALFTGTGNIVLPVTATGSSFASGPGNIVTEFHTSASTGITVVYDYTVVPEPSTLALLFAGALGLGFYGWRRRS